MFIGKEKRLSLGKRLLIMGIVNVTEDSFSDGGLYLDAGRAVNHALKLIEDGADIIDLGAESTRPGSQGIPPATQVERLLPVVKALRTQTQIPLSIDTTSAAVAEAMLQNGADIINDISAGGFDDEMFATVARHQAIIVLMHMQGTPQNMQVNPYYDDVVSEVAEFLQQAAARAEKAGILRDHIILDLGLGFGKTQEHNLLLMQNIPYLAGLGYPLLVAASRKTFLRRLLTGSTNAKAPNDDLDIATNVTTMLALQGGAKMVRAHNVRQAALTRKILEAMR